MYQRVKNSLEIRTFLLLFQFHKKTHFTKVLKNKTKQKKDKKQEQGIGHDLLREHSVTLSETDLKTEILMRVQKSASKCLTAEHWGKTQTLSNLSLATV